MILVFQPAEEGGGGARRDDPGRAVRALPDGSIGMHNLAGDARRAPSPSRTGLVLRPATSLASPSGARAVMAPCHTWASTRSRWPASWCWPSDHPDAQPASQIHRTGVISVTMIQAGEADQCGAQSVTLQGTVRTFTDETLDLIEERMREAEPPVERRFWCHRRVREFQRNCPPTINRSARRHLARQVIDRGGGGRAGGVVRGHDGGRRLQLLPAAQAGGVLRDWQRRWHAP